MPNTKIPDNWLDCPQITTEAIEGVVPLKVPLSSKYRYLKEKEWCWSKALEHYPDIGLVIDLTNTDRYYDKQELYDVDIDYIKTKMPGHGQIPKRGQMNNLAEKINRFVTEHPEKQVAIHCTHGFNRTGFLVCAYLKLFRGYTVPMAVASFAKIRQGGIYRTEIIQALYDFYHDEKITIADVPKPVWHTKEKKEKNKSAYKKESPKKPSTISNKQHSRSPPEASQEAAFSSASRNPLDDIDSRDTGTPVWIIPSRRKNISKK